MSGPLEGVRVLELSGAGAGPFAAMILGDAGADVIRIDRLGARGAGFAPDPLGRNRRSISIDLKSSDGVGVVLRLVESVDIIIEPFRPGVAERLGIGPDPCFKVNPRLIYGRMTGWGQVGPYSAKVGHDINYLGLAGVLFHIGRAGAPPTPPLNLVGDMAGGGFLLVFGLLCALHETQSSNIGQIVDAAMLDGAALLMTSVFGLKARGRWNNERGSNLIDSGAPFYDVYSTADDQLLAVGALERRFFEPLLEGCELNPQDWTDRLDPRHWPALREQLAEIFKTRTSDEWLAIFADTDACVTPVLSADHAPGHEHNLFRQTFVEVNDVIQPAPAPRFSRTITNTPRSAPERSGADTDAILSDLGFVASEILQLRNTGAVR